MLGRNDNQPTGNSKLCELGIVKKNRRLTTHSRQRLASMR
jgi:hypothetical protein